MNRQSLIEWVRLAYGVAQLARPASFARASGGATDATVLVIRRVLGARHIVQALLLLEASRSAHIVGGAVDVTHAATALILAARDTSRRGDALLNAVVTLMFAAEECR